jgi:competence ComEA-like helix-hairpin-helix protein
VTTLLLIGAALAPTTALESKTTRGNQGGDTKAAQTFTTVCSRCHPIERVTAMRRTRSQWEEVITTMITSRGAQVTDDDFSTILDYLVKEFGRVDINRAAAEDIVEVLGVTEKVAGAIVGYRKEHGRFEDFDALAKVPGVDRDELEKKRDAITF